jgi:hypothetical protein
MSAGAVAVRRWALEDEIAEALNASESSAHLASKFIALMSAVDDLRQAAGRGSKALGSAVAWYVPEGEAMGRAAGIRREWSALDAALAAFDSQEALRHV